MSSPFKNKELDCNASEMLDALTILHDLGIWDEYIYKWGVEDPAGLVDRVRNEQDKLIAEYEDRVTKQRVAVIFNTFGIGKIQFIKILREFTGMGLSETKLVSEALPWVLPWSYPRNDVHRYRFIALMNEIKASFDIQPCLWEDIRDRGEPHPKFRDFCWSREHFKMR